MRVTAGYLGLGLSASHYPKGYEHMATINYDALVNLQLLSVPDAQGRAKTEGSWHVTLADAVRMFMAMTTEQQRRATIFLANQIGQGGKAAVLQFKDIQELSQRADFPAADD